MNYITIKKASENWGITERRITALCRSGKIPNAYKEGRLWLIPSDTLRPQDGRTKEAKATMNVLERKPLPIGVSDFKEAVSKYYYVDKTFLIRDFLDSIPKVSLFTRPRRFGKTLNMDMLRVFFEKTHEDTSSYFQDKNIWKCGEKYIKHQGQYPVIFLSFKDVKFETWQETKDNISYILSNEYDRHKKILNGNTCSNSEKEYFYKVLNREATEQELTGALRELSKMLHEFYEKSPIIIIDEYDTPIQQGYSCEFYEKVILFMRNLFSGAFKDNQYLAYGFLTGILRVAKESIFSGLNNLKEHSIFDQRYSEYFGFTKPEVMEMLQYYGCEHKYDEIVEWYDGYRFGKSEMFNPWSVINYLDDKCIPKAFWQATGSNEIIRQIVAEATPEIQKNLQLLMRGEEISAYIDTSVIYPEIRKNPLTIYSFLLMAGYLKFEEDDVLSSTMSIYNVSIPNKEIFYVYEKEILSAMSEQIPMSTAIAIQRSILKQNVLELQNYLQEFLRYSVSFFDVGNESFYHGMVLGLSAIMNNLYRVTSNRESGDGCYDIQMESYNKELPGIIMELKYLKETDASDVNLKEKLQKLSEDALEQINMRHYENEMKMRGIEKIMKIGIAFHKKKCEISYQR